MPPTRIILFPCLTIAGSILILNGCAREKQPATAPPAAIAPRVVGEVAIVDEEKRFVLIDLESNLYVPAPGTELRATNAHGETAHLKASPEQKRPFVAADIVDGEPAVGDEVVR
jgi:hypothetical protein